MSLEQQVCYNYASSRTEHSPVQRNASADLGSASLYLGGALVLIVGIYCACNYIRKNNDRIVDGITRFFMGN
jgi:hypothetical protein